MPLELRPATEEDAIRAAEIEHLAYAGNPFERILFPGPFPPTDDGGRAVQLLDDLRGDPTTRWLKVVDTDTTGETMIAFARWHMYTEDEPPRSALRAFGPGCNEEACAALFGGIHEQRTRLMGERLYVCECPSFLRSGVTSLRGELN